MKHPFSFRPLVAFPRPLRTNRKQSSFRAGLELTLAQLGEELKAVKAKNAVVQLRLGDNGLRADGMPKVALSSPEVVLSFERESGAFSMPCDTYTDWRDNLRAIVLSLSALRAVDRYGVTQSGEQYRGWQALPPKSEEALDFESREEAAQWLGTVGNELPEFLLSHPAVALGAYRTAARKLHPDAGGDAADFRRLQKAREMLNIS